MCLHPPSISSTPTHTPQNTCTGDSQEGKPSLTTPTQHQEEEGSMKPPPPLSNGTSPLSTPISPKFQHSIWDCTSDSADSLSDSDILWDESCAGHCGDHCDGDCVGPCAAHWEERLVTQLTNHILHQMQQQSTSSSTQFTTNFPTQQRNTPKAPSNNNPIHQTLPISKFIPHHTHLVHMP